MAKIKQHKTTQSPNRKYPSRRRSKRQKQEGSQPINEDIKEMYEEDEITRTEIRGDGHCIVNSIIVSMKKHKELKKDDILSGIRKNFLKEIATYGEFISGMTDPMEEIEQYIKHGKYNSDIADIMINMISKQLKIRIIILEYIKEEKVFKLMNRNHIVTPNLKEEKWETTVFIEKRNQHYNALHEVKVTKINKNGERGIEESSVMVSKDAEEMEKVEEKKEGEVNHGNEIKNKKDTATEEEKDSNVPLINTQTQDVDDNEDDDDDGNNNDEEKDDKQNDLGGIQESGEDTEMKRGYEKDEAKKEQEEIEESPITKMYIGNLVESVSTKDLEDVLGIEKTPYLKEKCRVELQVDEKTGKSKSFAFLYVPEQVHEDVLKLHGIEFHGKQLTVKVTKINSEEESGIEENCFMVPIDAEVREEEEVTKKVEGKEEGEGNNGNETSNSGEGEGITENNENENKKDNNEEDVLKTDDNQNDENKVKSKKMEENEYQTNKPKRSRRPTFKKLQEDDEEENRLRDEREKQKRKREKVERGEVEANPKCPGCEKTVDQNESGVVCEDCDAYWHYDCVGTNNEEIQRLEGQEFCCPEHKEKRAQGVEGTQDDDHDDLDEEMEKLKDILETKEGQVEKLTDELQKSKNEIKRLREESQGNNVLIQEERKENDKKVREMTKKITKLEAENNQMKTKTERKSKEIEKKDEKIRKAIEENGKLKDAQKKKWEDKEKEDEEKQAAKDAEVEKERKAMKKEIENRNREVDIHITKVQELKKENTEMKERLELVKTKEKESENRKECVEQEKETQEERRESVEVNKGTKKTPQEYEKEIEKYRKEIEELTTKIERETKEQEERIKQIKEDDGKKKKELLNEIKKLKETTRKYEDRLESVLCNISGKERTIANLSEDLEIVKRVNKEMILAEEREKELRNDKDGKEMHTARDKRGKNKGGDGRGEDSKMDEHKMDEGISRSKEKRTQEGLEEDKWRKERRDGANKQGRRNVPCKYIKEGKRCPFGEKCWFKHEHEHEENEGKQDKMTKNHREKEEEEPECWHFKTGRCPYGQQCRFSHGRESKISKRLENFFLDDQNRKTEKHAEQREKDHERRNEISSSKEQKYGNEKENESKNWREGIQQQLYSLVKELSVMKELIKGKRT